MKGKIVILGAGESGLGTAFLACKKGLNVFISDNDSISKKTKKKLNLMGVSWEERKHSYSKMKDADWIIKSPGIDNKSKVISQLREMDIPIISEIEFASKFTNSKIIAITGSNGKTTTALLTHHLLSQGGLKVGIAGNIGNSFAKEIAENNYDCYILEVSSFQLDDINQIWFDGDGNIVDDNDVPEKLRKENQEKLAARYGEKFEVERSEVRKKGDL